MCKSKLANTFDKICFIIKPIFYINKNYFSNNGKNWQFILLKNSKKLKKLLLICHKRNCSYKQYFY